ncbi:MAG: DUF4390 domain-containing protein [Gammaproteobacteria bacterium]|jgi:hypothetical protein|nr:DUF4390 domain-containing protein [Gammaproteobacteria bacterium]
MKAARPGRRLATRLVPLLLVLACGASLAQDDQPFVVEHADFTLDQSMMLLDLVVESELPDYITIALDQGFSVPLMFEVEILASKRYWLDERVVWLKQQYHLHYQPMLDSYVVFDVNNAERRYFDNRNAAVRFLEVVYNYPMLDIRNLAPNRDYYARVRFGIDSDALPLPLKSSSLWDNNWDLTSDWYEWDVQGPGQ